MTCSAIAATGVRKSFGTQVVLHGVDLDVAAGSIFALLDRARDRHRVALTLGFDPNADPLGNGGVLAVAWSAGGGCAAHLWAKRLYDRQA